MEKLFCQAYEKFLKEMFHQFYYMHSYFCGQAQILQLHNSLSPVFRRVNSFQGRDIFCTDFLGGDANMHGNLLEHALQG